VRDETLEKEKNENGTFSMLVHIECHEYWENKKEYEVGHIEIA
jgi:hypothetical protein